MSQVARLESTLAFNDAAFTQGIERAEKRAQTFAGRVESSFQGLFRRTPGRKAEKALTGLLGDISTGDLSTGITSFASRLTGLGLAAGVGVGVAVELFQHFKSQIDETKKAGEALRTELLKPLSITTSLSAAGMDQALESRKKLAADLQEKAQNRFGSELAETFQSLLNAPGANFSATAGKERLGQDIDLNRAEAGNKEIMMARAKLAERIVGLKAEEAFGDEHAARVSRIMLETEQARAELKTKGLTHAAFEVADKAAVAQGGVALALENKREESKNRSLETEEKMARLTRAGLKPEDARKVRAGIELKSLDQQIAEETDPGRKRVLSLERLNKENEIRSFGKPASGPDFGSISAREAETNNPNAWGSLAWSAAQRGEIPAGEEQNPTAELLKATQETNKILTEAWLK